MSRTIPLPSDRGVHEPDLAVHDREIGVHGPDLGVHVAAIPLSTNPISVSTISRSRCPQSADPGVHDGPTHAVIRRGDETHAFLVEIDRGTVATARMRQKYLGFLGWRRTGGPESRFGIRAMRVLTIAPKVQRLERLREVAREASVGSGSGFLWFALATDIRADDPARFLGPIWKVVREEPDPVPLFRSDVDDDLTLAA